jgi:glucose-1-phosphate thymidylyltransferase
MKCIILAAGYATRLYPLTINKPKPLLEVSGISILDRIIKKVEKVSIVDDIIIITNDKFYTHFLAWKKTYQGPKTVTVLNDHTTSNETRLGAVKDILYVVDSLLITDDLMILAGDNLFDFELTDFELFFRNKNTNVITTHAINDPERLKRTGVAELDSNYKLISFEEKPKEPKSNLAVPPFYIYKKESIPLIKQFIDEGHNGDAPGMLLGWLLKKSDIHAYLFKGNRYDIGTIDSYNEVQKIFKDR